MMLTLLCALVGISAPQSVAPVSLLRVSKANEKLAYQVDSHLMEEIRGMGLDTWLPQDLEVKYGFTTQVTEVKPEGVVVMHYLRPLMTEVHGETADAGPREDNFKVNLNMILTISPINEIVSERTLTDKKGPKSSGDNTNSSYATEPLTAQDQIGGMLQQFIQEIQLLALNTGSLDSALDFSPKLPFDDVKPGDTWKFTVGYSPQMLKGSKDKSAVQRLDYTYTYIGVVDTGKRKVYRVTADLNLNTDLAPFVHQATGINASVTGIKSINLNLKTHIDFDLDMQTRQTLHAASVSEGGFNIVATNRPDTPVEEQRLHGKTQMHLVGRA
jgi:hypothetical protein